jgi:hypothetical protein
MKGLKELTLLVSNNRETGGPEGLATLLECIPVRLFPFLRFDRLNISINIVFLK